jgi:hypothetical protein
MPAPLRIPRLTKLFQVSENVNVRAAYVGTKECLRAWPSPAQANHPLQDIDLETHSNNLDGSDQSTKQQRLQSRASTSDEKRTAGEGDDPKPTGEEEEFLDRDDFEDSQNDLVSTEQQYRSLAKHAKHAEQAHAAHSRISGRLR